ncbi:TPA: hypothetical protein ACSRPO_000401 [Enterobacter asburiae]
MYLVKSCYKRDNIRIRNTIKIGTLTEYRDTEEQQIADRHEGKINLFFDLKKFHMPLSLLNQINTFSNSSSNFFLQDVQIRPNPLFANHVYAEVYSATSSLIKLNRYIFCISELNHPNMCHDIFNDYDDYWHFNRDTVFLFGEMLSRSVLKEVINRTKDGEALFTTNITTSDFLTVRWYCNRILYTPRQIFINNTKLYKEHREILYCLSEGHMVKPIYFKHEHEVRFIFDVYLNGSLLEPLNKSLFVSAENIMPIIKL